MNENEAKIKVKNVSNLDFVTVEIQIGPLEEPIEVIEYFDINTFKKYMNSRKEKST